MTEYKKVQLLILVLRILKTDLAHLKKVVVIGDDLSKSLFYVRENLEALFNKGVGHKYIVRTGSSGAYKYKYKEDKGSISSKKKPVLKFGYDGEKNGAMYKDYFIWKDDGKFYIWKQLGEEAGSDDDPDASFNTEAEVINYINKINKFEQTYSKEQAKIYAEGGVPLSKVEESKLKADLIKLKKVKMSTPSHQLHIRHIEKVLEEGKKAYGDRGIFELLMQ